MLDVMDTYWTNHACLIRCRKIIVNSMSLSWGQCIFFLIVMYCLSNMKVSQTLFACIHGRNASQHRIDKMFAMRRIGSESKVAPGVSLPCHVEVRTCANAPGRLCRGIESWSDLTWSQKHHWHQMNCLLWMCVGVHASSKQQNMTSSMSIHCAQWITKTGSQSSKSNTGRARSSCSARVWLVLLFHSIFGAGQSEQKWIAFEHCQGTLTISVANVQGGLLIRTSHPSVWRNERLIAIIEIVSCRSSWWQKEWTECKLLITYEMFRALAARHQLTHGV